MCDLSEQRRELPLPLYHKSANKSALYTLFSSRTQYYVTVHTFILKIFFEFVAFSAISEYTINEPIACRSSRLEYDERVCLASASDGVL